MYGHFINPIINETSDLIDDLGFITMRDYYTTYSDMKQNDNMYITSLPEGYNITDIVIDVIEPFVDNETSVDWDEAELSDTSEKWWSVCCSDDIFVATAGNTNSFMYSYDGMTWNEGTISSGAHNWYSVCYGNGIFISVASDGYSAYSTDGKNWTEKKISNTSRLWRCVTYGNGRFVAMAQNSTYSAWTTNGSSWTEVNMGNNNIESNYWYSICYGNGKFIATALDTRVIYSTNGSSWSYSNTISSNKKYWYTSCYAKNLFVIAGYRISNDAVVNENNFAYSTDGIRWTEGKISNAARYWRKVIYGDDMFIASADNSYFAYSTDGKNWTETRLANDDKRYEAICYGNDRYIAIAQNTNSFNYSESHKNQNFAIITNTGETLLHKDWLDVSNANIYENDVYYHVTGIPKEIILNHNLRSCSSGRMRLLFKLIKE